jgi:membrane-associated phospholipid phosphatase
MRHQSPGRRPLLLFLLVWMVAYALLLAAGEPAFVYRSLIVPAFAAAALATRSPADFARDWLPLLTAVVLFDALRGAAYALSEAGVLTVRWDYVITLERFATGRAAVPAALQTALRSPRLDTALTLVHASHFLFFLSFGLVLRLAQRDAFLAWRRALVIGMYAGLAGYYLLPTAPPWLAADHGLTPPVSRIVHGAYLTHIPRLYAVFDTNPVAAMPSVHVVFPIVCALVAWRWMRTLAASAVTAYALAVCFAVVYLGEHYAVDVIAGAIVALASSIWFGKSHLRTSTPSKVGLNRTLLPSGAACTAAFVISRLSE